MLDVVEQQARLGMTPMTAGSAASTPYFTPSDSMPLGFGTGIHVMEPSEGRGPISGPASLRMAYQERKLSSILGPFQISADKPWDNPFANSDGWATCPTTPNMMFSPAASANGSPQQSSPFVNPDSFASHPSFANVERAPFTLSVPTGRRVR